LAALTGCAGTAATTPPTQPEQVVEMEELRISARRSGGGYMFDVYDANELFTEATRLLDAKQCQPAVTLYDRVATEFGTSRYASASLYNAGLCLQALGDFAGSAQRYEALRDRYPASGDVEDASFQLAEVLVQLERFDDVVTIADELLARETLSADERLEAMARRSQGLLGAGRIADAERSARGALTYFRTRGDDEKIVDEFFAAANNYVLAESVRMREQGLAFPTEPEEQKKVLVRRAELVLEAQREYFNTIGFRNLDNVFWAAASGYRIGSLYDELWHAVMHAPVPPHLPPEGHAVYRGELAKLVKPLIRHAIRYWELTLMMIERTGGGGAWAEKTREDLERVRALMLEQPPGPGGIEHLQKKEGGQATPEQAPPVAKPPAAMPPAARPPAAAPAAAPPPAEADAGPTPATPMP
jgi:tetratricopeptide (TPR) repeat protein